MKENGKKKHGGNGGKRHPDEIPDVTYIKNEDITHELSDVPVSPIAKFIVILFVLMVATAAFVLGLYKYFESRAQAEENSQLPASRVAPPASMLGEQGQRLPPEPRLQGAEGHKLDPVEEMQQLQSEWDARLKGYGWVDQQTGAVHIPIEDAKKRLLERGGLVTRPPAQPPRQTGTPGQTAAPGGPGDQRPSGSSSGRTAERGQ